MHEKIWAPRARRAVAYTPVLSSRDRFWSGFEATLYAATDGINECVFTDHSISMHVGAPVVVGSRCDGETLRRLQVPGDLKIVPAGVSRIWETEGPTIKLTVDISPALLRTAADAMGIDADRVALAPQLHLRDPLLEHVCRAILAELESADPVGRLYADSLGLAVAAHLLRRYAPVVPRRAGRAFSKRRLQAVIDHIHDHLAGELALADLAALAHVSTSHFKVLFKESVGEPVHRYVVRCRVAYALDLLQRSSQPLCDVALIAGFANQSHMARCVRRSTGATPAEIRRKAG